MTVEKAAKAGAWSAIDMIVRQGVNFAVVVILARLLVPADFGIVALVTFFSSLSIVFVQGGLSLALVQRQQSTLEEESSVFWWNLGGSFLFAGFLVLISPAVARFYGHDVIEPLMWMAAAQVVLSALGAVQTALLTRALRFDRLTLAGLVSSVVSGAAGIAAALLGAGVWALAIQFAGFAAINSAILWPLSGWRPIVHFRWATISPLFRFGMYMSLSSLLDVFYSQGFALIIGKLHGVREVGLYNRAASTQALPSNMLGVIVGRLVLPLFSARADDVAALRRGLRMANSIAMILNLPTMLGLAVLADLVIITLFGDQWIPAAPILSVLALSGILVPLHVNNLQVLLARSESGRFFRNEVIKKFAGMALIIASSFFGIMGLAWGTVTFSVLALGINSVAARKSLEYGPGAQLWDLRGLLVPSGAMVGLLLILEPLLPYSPPLKLALLTAAGAAAYFAVGLGFRFQSFLEARTIGLSLWKREGALSEGSP